MMHGMKKFVALLIALVIGFGALTAHAQTKQPAYNAPGTEFAHNLSVLTGVAISPLLGTSAYGAIKYWKTPAAQRGNLPWFAQPWFFGPALLLVAVCLLKDTAGTALPTAMKKPMDIAEAVENKISGIVATGAFVPFLMLMMNDATNSSPGASLSSMGVATIGFSEVINILLVPVSMIAFLIVFLASNAINVLIILSPFTTVDAALKGLRLAVLGTVTATAWANPWVGAAWALVVIIISYFIAGWSFRLSFFGFAFVWDYFTLRRMRFTPDAKENRMFLGRKIDKVPTRTYGRLSRNEAGHLVLKYRPWLVLPERTLVLPEGSYAVGRGAFFTEILQVEGDDFKTALVLPPRYRGDEEKLTSIYGLTDVRPIGLHAMWVWLKETLGFKAQPVAAL
jgi:hypothetical protein